MATTSPLPPEVTKLTPTAAARIAGGSFLISNAAAADCFFPEDFTAEHRQIAQTTADFATNEIVPQSDAIEHKDFAVTRRLIKEAAELGLTAADIPEEYGGLEMDKASSAIIAENISKQGSFSVAFSAHTGIGTLPLVWYGTPEQKQRYLPHIADGSMVGAYALSESSSGSDAVNASTKAVLSEDRQTYTLNGEKMWITNGGFADLFTIFAKCLVTEGKDAGKERLTAFLVERGDAGIQAGERGAQAGDSRVFDDAADPDGLQNSRGEPAGRGGQGPPYRVQYPECGPVQAGQCGGGRGADGVQQRAEVLEGAEGVWQGDLRVRADPGEAGEHGDGDLCRRGGVLSDGRVDR